MKNQLSLIVNNLLSQNKIVFDKEELAFQIQSHPSYPSLHAITGVLDHFNIENVAAEVPVNADTLHQLPDSFIAQVNTDKGNDLVAVHRSKNEYNVQSGDKKKKRIQEGDFLKQFTGIIVAVEKSDEVSSQNNKNLASIVLVIVLGLLVVNVFINKGITITDFVYVTLTILGVVVSYSIVKQDIGEYTAIGNAFCTGGNEKKDCDAVLNSKGAEVIKNHKLSDLSIIYFTALFLSTLISKNFDIIYMISILSLPITLYSIYYQYFVVKSWCTLCLSIVGILWFQCALIFMSVDVSTLINASVESYNMTILSFVTTYLGWYYVKPLLKDVNELKSEKIGFVKFKRNFSLFNTLLEKSPILSTKIERTKELILGNENAKIEVVIITNPFCGHCKPVHKVVNELLQKHKESVKVVVRFNVPIEDTKSNGVVVTARLLQLYNEKGSVQAKEAMDDIYGEMGFDKWLMKWKKADKPEPYIEILQKEKEWCHQNAINFTPEILVNGRSFPKEYDRKDLPMFIEDLEEQL